MATIDENGREILDPTPVSIPVPFDRPEPLHLRIRRMILAAQQEAGDGYETEEEANDFDVPDDPNPDPTSIWEENFLPPVDDPAASPPSTTELSQMTVEQAEELLRAVKEKAAQVEKESEKTESPS